MKKAILNKYALNGYTVHSNLPIGAPMPWLSDNLPVGFLAFDGSEYNQSDYPELYNVVKNIPSFHSDTEGKFKIPNLKGRVLQGADTVIGELIEAGLPNIIGEVKNNDASYGSIQMVNPKFVGAFSGKPHGNAGWSGSVWGCHTLKIDASKGETKTDGTIKGTDEPHVYGNSDTVQPPAFTVRWIIKATQYSTVEQNAIDDTRFTTGNVLSAAKTMELWGFEVGQNENGYYKKYANGLLECWGITTTQNTEVTLPMPYKDTSFNINVTVNRNVEAPIAEGNPNAYAMSNEKIYIFSNTGGRGTFWQTIGFWK